jgi:lipopolysaccharide transport system permease protein
MTDPVPELIIEAGRTEAQYFRDLWRYRELFYFLAWRDILVRYKQTAIGVGCGSFEVMRYSFPI